LWGEGSHEEDLQNMNPNPARGKIKKQVENIVKKKNLCFEKKVSIKN